MALDESQEWYDELDDRTAYYVFCAYDHARQGGPVPRARVDSWQADLERLHGPIRRHETARLLYFLTPFSEVVIGRLIDVPPLWLNEAFEPWDVTAGCGHRVKAHTRRAVKTPPKTCWQCGPGHVEQQLFKLPPMTMSWIEYYARFERPGWPLIRRKKLRDHPHCAVCHATARLDVHHNTYKRFGRERLEDLTVLCRRCHDTFHDQRRTS